MKMKTALATMTMTTVDRLVGRRRNGRPAAVPGLRDTKQSMQWTTVSAVVRYPSASNCMKGVLGMGLFKAMVAVLVLIAAVADAEAVSIGMVPLSYGNGGELSNISIMLLVFVQVIGFALILWIIVTIGDIIQNVWLYFRSRFREE